MKHNVLFMLLCLVLLSLSLSARPVHDCVVALVQPDGSVFQARFRGDEFLRIKTTLNGCAIIQDPDGWWSYAAYGEDGRKYSSGVHVGDNAPYAIYSRSRDIPYRKLSELASRRRAAICGEPYLLSAVEPLPLVRSDADPQQPVVKHGIVILAEFADLSFKYEREDFVNLLTGNDYTRDGATGCAKKYFDDQFGDKVEFLFDVSNIVTLPRELAWYGANWTDSNGTESDKNPTQMVIDACNLADPEVDFSLYDDDGDGQVDNVFVFFAGGDEAEGAGDDCIWSHFWYVKDGAGRNLELDGKVINRYACTAELSRRQEPDGEIVQTLAGIGTFCHEYSHTFGLADMYDTDYGGSGGESEALWGSTSLMDGGNQNNSGNTPPFFNAIEREMLGISVPEVIAADGTYSLDPIHRSGKCYRIDTDIEGEYFLLECRQADSWDTFIGGSGLLVYHVDKTDRDAGFSEGYDRNLTALSRWKTYNEVNCRPDHQCADLVEALPDASNVRNVFFPVADRNALEADDMVYWSGEKGSMSITGIRRDGDRIIFNVVGFSEDTTPPDPVKIGSVKFQDSAIITFESDRAFDGEAVVSWGKSGRESDTLRLKPYEQSKYALVLDDLEPRTSYTVTFSFVIDGVSGKEGSASFMTASYSGGYPYIYMKNVLRNPDGSFPAGSRLPLKVYNAVGAADIEWSLDGKVIRTGADGYYELLSGGLLKVVVSWEDGSRDVILKELTVR